MGRSQARRQSGRRIAPIRFSMSPGAIGTDREFPQFPQFPL